MPLRFLIISNGQSESEKRQRCEDDRFTRVSSVCRWFLLAVTHWAFDFFEYWKRRRLLLRRTNVTIFSTITSFANVTQCGRVFHAIELSCTSSWNRMKKQMKKFRLRMNRCIVAYNCRSNRKAQLMLVDAWPLFVFGMRRVSDKFPFGRCDRSRWLRLCRRPLSRPSSHFRMLRVMAVCPSLM